MKTSNRNARTFVQNLETFKANNLFGEQYSSQFYVVYSYGYHWPLFVHNRYSGKWYGNASKYSVTTGKHRSQANPSVDDRDLTWLAVDQIKALLLVGEVIK